ncbi:MAG TPA: hypothetical protein VIL20_13540 [Sandaracinaceae bacterium]
MTGIGVHRDEPSATLDVSIDEALAAVLFENVTGGGTDVPLPRNGQVFVYPIDGQRVHRLPGSLRIWLEDGPRA